ALHAAFGPDTRLGVLYNVSNGGGAFDAVLQFSDGSSATVTLGAPDWFQSQTPPPANPGVLTVQQLGAYSAASNQDIATTGAPSLNVVEAIVSTASLASGGLGDVTGKRLTALTFTNPVPGDTAGYEILGATLRDWVPNNSSIPPIGAGAVSPN